MSNAHDTDAGSWWVEDFARHKDAAQQRMRVEVLPTPIAHYFDQQLREQEHLMQEIPLRKIPSSTNLASITG